MEYQFFVRGCSLIYLLYLAVQLNKQTKMILLAFQNQQKYLWMVKIRFFFFKFLQKAWILIHSTHLPWLKKGSNLSKLRNCWQISFTFFESFKFNKSKDVSVDGKDVSSGFRNDIFCRILFNQMNCLCVLVFIKRQINQGQWKRVCSWPLHLVFKCCPQTFWII